MISSVQDQRRLPPRLPEFAGALPPPECEDGALDPPRPESCPPEWPPLPPDEGGGDEGCVVRVPLFPLERGYERGYERGESEVEPTRELRRETAPLPMRTGRSPFLPVTVLACFRILP
jgi:hypothetical protein